MPLAVAREPASSLAPVLTINLSTSMSVTGLMLLQASSSTLRCISS